MPLSELVQALEEIAPRADAAAWDNVGLLVGDPAQHVTRVLLAIDCTKEVLAEAKAERCEAIVSYHPPIFGKLDRVTSDGAGALVYDAIRTGIAIYSPHTALDVAEGGTNDVLADILGMKDRAPLATSERRDTDYKLVFFVPTADVERVSRAVFDAGAGRIGAYASCSFRSSGTGTFFGGEGTSPAVGERGRLEQVEELRVETLVPVTRMEPVLAALRAAHPYEEPAFDLVRLAPRPRRTGMERGMGRIGNVDPIERATLVERIKIALGVERVLVAGPMTGTASRVAACAGSAGDLAFEAMRCAVDLYLTGELRHHDALRAAEGGMTVVCALHSASERVALPHLARRLARALPTIDFVVSRVDRDPFRFV